MFQQALLRKPTPSATSSRRWWRAHDQLPLLTALVIGLSASLAHADEPRFGAHDIQTLFFISKSDDRNRVDYGMRLDENCLPAKSDAIFPYWREFENSPPVRTHALGMFEYVAYGVSEQRTVQRGPTGGQVLMKLKQVGRPIWVITQREANGRCSASSRTTIAGVPAELISIYVKLQGPLSVAYLDVKGRDLKTQKIVTERVER